jgi:hypothetical protein
LSEDKSNDLVVSIDAAAQYLLKQASTPNTNAEGVEPATLAEQVKAFQAVVAWADRRRELIPKERTESTFDRLTGDFHGSPPRRRRGRPASPNGAGDIASADGESLDA